MSKPKGSPPPVRVLEMALTAIVVACGCALIAVIWLRYLF